MMTLKPVRQQSVMWRTAQLTSSLACFLLIRCEANSSDCQMPTEDAPISICSYCSDSHAGLRWAAHSSTIDKYPNAPYEIDLMFRCRHFENETELSLDGCFNGDLFPGLWFLTSDIWRWHIVGQRLPIGTECHFTAIFEDGNSNQYPELTTSCTVHENGSTVILPVTCSSDSSEPLACSCQCAEGFKADVEVNQILTCLNVDECSEGTHRCNNVSNCVDMEGSYDCTNENETTTSATPDHTATDILNHTNTILVTTDESDDDEIRTTTTSESTINNGIFNDITVAQVSKTRTLPPATTHDTLLTMIHTSESDRGPDPRLVSAGVAIAVFLVSIIVSVVIAISILRRKQCLGRDKMMTTSPQLADAFDPDFYPVNIEKFVSHSPSAVSTKTFLDPLQWSRDPEVLSTTNSLGSVIVLDFCEHPFTTIIHDNDYIES